MSAEAIRTIVATRLNAKWATGNPVSPTPSIAWPGREFTPSSTAAHARMDIATAAEEHIGVAGAGRGAYLTTGLINIRCFVPRNSGTLVAAKLGDHAAKIFRGFSDSGLTVLSAVVSDLPEESAAPWVGTSMRAEFQYWVVNTYTA